MPCQVESHDKIVKTVIVTKEGGVGGGTAPIYYLRRNAGQTSVQII